jgi:streptogramin lyase
MIGKSQKKCAGVFEIERSQREHMMTSKRKIPIATSLLIAAVTLNACAGGQGQGSLPSAPLQNLQPNTKAAPNASRGAPKRRDVSSGVAYVYVYVPAGSAALGISIAVYPQGNHSGAPINGVNAALTGSACSGGYCGFVLSNLGAGPDDYVYTAYNAAPVGGSFSGAQVVGSGITNEAFPADGTQAIVLAAIGGTMANANVWLSQPSVDQIGKSTFSVFADAQDSSKRSIITLQSQPIQIQPTQGQSSAASDFTWSGGTGCSSNGSWTFSSPNPNGCSIEYNSSAGSSAAIDFAPNVPDPYAAADLSLTPPAFNSFTSANAGLPAGAKPFAITAGPNNTLWFTDQGTNEIGTLNDSLGANITEYSVAAPDKPLYLAYDPTNQVIWYDATGSTEYSINAIDTRGQLEFYNNLPLNGNSPQGVAVHGGIAYVAYGGVSGSDNWNAWVNMQSLNQAMIPNRLQDPNTPSGSSCCPQAVAVDSSGNIWVTTNGLAPEVWELSATGLFENEITLSPHSIGEAIVPDSDGNMWVADQAGAIWKITAGGTATPYSLPSGCKPSDIVAGPVNLWFTCSNINEIGRITPAGVPALYPTGIANGAPNQLIVGPDNNIWYTDSGNNEVVQMVLSP